LNIAVIGTGYVGLVAGSCFAESGNDVICVDSDQDKIKALSKGQTPIYEPGLPELVQRNLAQGRLGFTTDLAAAVKKSFVLFIAVGTPQVGGEIDLTAVRKVASEIGRSMKEFKVIVMKSTVPVGMTEQIRDVIRAETDQPFDVVSNPEFMKEGTAIEDFMKPDRVILGVEDERAAELVRELYAPFVRTGSPVLITDVRTAEMTKYASNAYLATRVSFMNEIANLCESSGADVDVVRRGMGLDRRIGPSFLFPGVGFGGSCFPKDVEALIATGRRQEEPLRILEAVARVNAYQRVRFLERIVTHFDGDVAGKRVAVWGLAFKPRTNDMRESPAIDIIEGLLEGGTTVVAYDPEAMEEARKIFGSRVEFAGSDYECVAGADALLLITEWQAFRNPNFDRMKNEMRQATVFDGRNVYDPKNMQEMGFTYYGIGRK
jgi:UDPglucose 6-dehydrogenase